MVKRSISPNLRGQPAPEGTRSRVLELLRLDEKGTARALGVDRITLTRVAAGLGVRAGTILRLESALARLETSGAAEGR